MKKIIVASFSAVSLALGGAAYAAIPDPAGVIHGCRSNLLHTLTVIDSANSSCPIGTTALNWNQSGPEGPQGPIGPQGPQGEPAPTPTTSTYTVSTSVALAEGQTEVLVALQCNRNINSDQVVPGSGSYGFYTLTTEVIPVVGATHVSVYFDGAVSHAHGGSQTYELGMQFDPIHFGASSFFVQALCVGPTPA